MQRDEKAKIIEALNGSLAQAPSVVLASTTGISVNSVNELRKKLRQAGAHYEVVKNTLAKRAIAGTAMEPLAPKFVGPVAVVFHPEDPAICAKILLEFKKTNDKLEVKGGYVDGTVLDAKGVEALSKMPGKNEIRATLIGLLLAAPTKLVSTVIAPHREIIGLVIARGEDLEKQSAA